MIAFLSSSRLAKRHRLVYSRHRALIRIVQPTLIHIYFRTDSQKIGSILAKLKSTRSQSAPTIQPIIKIPSRSSNAMPLIKASLFP